MKYLTGLIVGLSVFVVVGCNTASRKDPVLAQVGGTALYGSQMDLVLGSQAPQEQGTQARNDLFDKLLESTLQAETAKHLVPKAKSSVDKTLAGSKKRDLAQQYQNKYLTENYAHTEEQLLAWYRKHLSEFTKDSLAQSFEQVRKEVAKRLTLEERATDLLAFFAEREQKYQNPDSVDLGLFKGVDSLQVARAISTWKQGGNFDSLAAQLSAGIDPVLSGQKGHAGWVTPATLPTWLIRIPNIREQLFDSSRGIGPGSISGISALQQQQRTDTSHIFVAFVAFGRKHASHVGMAQIKAKVESEFLGFVQRKLIENSLKDLDAYYKPEYIPIPTADPKVYYTDHPDEFQTHASYHLLHLEMKDSATLAQLLSGIKSESDFRKLATTQNLNEYTRTHAGDAGWIKADHFLPWGLGNIPQLTTELEGKPVGLISSVLQNSESQNWHVFWLLESKAPVLKPFEQVESIAQIRMKAIDMPLDSNTVHVKLHGAVLITEKDVQTLLKEIPPSRRYEFKRAKVLEFLRYWNLGALRAVELGYDKSPDFKALLHLREIETWASVYKDSLQNQTLGFDSIAIRKVFAQNPGLMFDSVPAPNRVHVAALWLDIPDYTYQREFILHPDRYPGVKLWSEGKVGIFKQIKDDQGPGVAARLRIRALRMFPLQVLDTMYHPKILVTAKEMLQEGIRLYDARSLEESRNILEQVRSVYPDDSLAIRASIMLAQSANEQENYPVALDEYTVLYALWPNHPDAYKALFMKGFIQSENLKQDSLALISFQELLQKYPKSDLSDDAEWMVRNIQSGGKLAPALLDSIAQQDSAQAPIPTQK